MLPLNCLRWMSAIGSIIASFLLDTGIVSAWVLPTLIIYVAIVWSLLTALNNWRILSLSSALRLSRSGVGDLDGRDSGAISASGDAVRMTSRLLRASKFLKSNTFQINSKEDIWTATNPKTDIWIGKWRMDDHSHPDSPLYNSSFGGFAHELQIYTSQLPFYPW